MTHFTHILTLITFSYIFSSLEPVTFINFKISSIEVVLSHFMNTNRLPTVILKMWAKLGPIR
jgi:hypothetical protein